ncbi:hypothetical protein [Acidaminococcus timonensis]|uniref:hypothetical protein n=1 Tax=Acidaminococcus timonensis TaxID=1871002 RepID=UPI0026EA19B8|nr:hypothetical protein [Acidaminococcus timonensis]
MFKRILTFCLMAILGCFTITAQAADRWKWYYSSEHYGYYYDTQTVTYDAESQSATVWIKELFEDGSLLEERHIMLDYGHKTLDTYEYVTYPYRKDGPPKRMQPSTIYFEILSPDSPNETLARMVAGQLGIQPMYQAGPDRWKWIRATDEYSLYIAKDAIVYSTDKRGYSIWAKRVYLNGNERKTQYFCDTIANLVRTEYSSWNSPLPDSDEEAVLNAVKALNVGA